MTSVFETTEWWNKKGPFKVLHALTPLRMNWILRVWKTNPEERFPLKGWTILDVGCGGGLLSEPLARLGAHVIGLDESPHAISAARAHAGSLSIDYYVGSIDTWCPPEGQTFQGIIAMEVLEHLAHPFLALKRCVSWMAPGGGLVGSTLNRTTASYVMGILAAEHILKWVPKGTHQWHDFLSPKELTLMMKAIDLQDIGFQGYTFWPFQWQFSACQAVTYFFSGKKSCASF